MNVVKKKKPKTKKGKIISLFGDPLPKPKKKAARHPRSWNEEQAAHDLAMLIHGWGMSHAPPADVINLLAQVMGSIMATFPEDAPTPGVLMDAVVRYYSLAKAVS